MPLYEYRCQDCQATLELLVRSSTEQPQCTACGSLKLEKMLSVAAAPAVAGGGLPVCEPSAAPTCGRPQCGSGCMFD